MNEKIVNLLETKRANSSVDYLDFLSADEVNLIMDWYNNEISFDEKVIEKAIELMYFFYVHENLDLYEVSIFKDKVKMISHVHQIKEDDVLNKYIEFKKLVFN